MTPQPILRLSLAVMLMHFGEIDKARLQGMKLVVRLHQFLKEEGRLLSVRRQIEADMLWLRGGRTCSTSR